MYNHFENLFVRFEKDKLTIDSTPRYLQREKKTHVHKKNTCNCSLQQFYKELKYLSKGIKHHKLDFHHPLKTAH